MGLEAYEVGETIAESRNTILRRAIRKSDGARVVLKSLIRAYPTASELGQLQFEYRLIRKLDGTPGVVRAFALETGGNGPVLALEDGGSSLNLFSGRTVPLETFFSVAIALARTLGHIHQRDVIHKDITPSNILFEANTGAITLIDFGIASELSREHHRADSASQLEGTLPYVSPEQTGRMNRDLDYRTDYYSLGVSLFELLTGSLPFHADDVMGWVHCHISKPAPSARDMNPMVPESLSRVVRKLMAKNPDDRYQSAHGIVEDLEACRAEQLSGQTRTGFFPGAFDVSERLHVSETLFGREREMSALRSAFEQASRGRARLVLLGGYSGIGKTALIGDLQRDVVIRQGRFAQGKFDQLERNVPYGVLMQAIRSLVKHLLREPEARLAEWRHRAAAALGPNRRLLVELVPDLESELGAGEPVPALSPREAQARFQRMLAEFIKASAPAEHPLVLFIDDLQWADPSTTEFLVYLLSDHTVEHLTVIGSYRDNEVHPGHLLLGAVERIRARAADAVVDITLNPLTQESVNAIVAETLRCDHALSAPLAELITHKTGGNPFFVKELLNLLARDGAFRFVAPEGRWYWDHEKIQAAAVSDNVIDLMVGRLRQLPEATLASLHLAACIGNRFELGTLALIAGKSPGNLAAGLRRAVEERVLIPLGNGYRLIQEDQHYDDAGLAALGVAYQFQHDRVQQAAYSLLAPEERARAHLTIGRLLHAARQGHGRADEASAFEIVNHLNRGRSLIGSVAERLELVALNEAAGRRAKRATAYATATVYFETALDLLSAEEWAEQPQRQFECRRASAECIFYSGDPERAQTLCQELAARAPNLECRVAALELRAKILDYQARLPEAIATFSEALQLLGLTLPLDGPDLDRQIGEGIGKMQGHLARVPIEDFVRLPEMTDRQKIRINDLLFQLVVPAIAANPPLFILIELLMFDLALSYGTTAASCKNFVDCGIIQGAVLGDYERAYRLGKVAFEFLGRESSKPLASAVSFVFASFVSHWRMHYRESFEAYVDTERWGLELGDMPHTTYAAAISTQRWFFVGRPLDTCESKAVAATAILKQAGAQNQLNGVLLVQRAMARLRGSPDDQALLREESDAEFTERLRATKNAQWLFLHGHSQVLLHTVLGDLAAAATWNAFAANYLVAGGRIHYSIVDQYLLDTLVCAHRSRSLPEPERSKALEHMDENVAQLELWAKNCPENFAHKHKFASAELARARGAALDVVLSLYSEALAAAGDDFLHLRALINERLGEFWLEAAQPKIARLYLTEAYAFYESWGAGAKLRQLRQAHPFLFDAGKQAWRVEAFAHDGHRTHVVHASALDLESMIKATRTISGEVKREKVFAKLMSTIIENAGAQRGCLILESQGELCVQASTPAEGAPTAPTSIENSGSVCAPIVRYVARTMDTVVLDDASRDARFRDDPYVSANAVRSVLCMPVSSQGKLVAVLYAENNAATHAFTAGRLKLLEVIAAQAAISITNAQLYDSLELKVFERTRELSAKTAEVTAILNSLQQGVFTVDDQLRVGPSYSPHLEQLLGTRTIANEESIELLFAGSTLGEDAREMARSALIFGFGVPVSLAAINWAHLPKEFQRAAPSGEVQHLEIDWSPIVGEEGNVDKMLVVVRDVTGLRELRAAAARSARELDIIAEILERGVLEFRRFCDATRGAMREMSTLLPSTEKPTRDLVELSFRHLHTAKGNARMLGLTRLVDIIHEAEESYVELRRRPETAVDPKSLLAGVERVLAGLAEYEAVANRKLGDVRSEADRRSTEALDAIATIICEVGRGNLSADDAVGRIDGALKRRSAIPLRDLVAECARMLPSLARELGKTPPSVQCGGATLELKPTWAKVMRDVLVHALRNALDHGIESPEQRTAAGKAVSGQISVLCSRAESRITVRIRDDGQGLRVEALRRAGGNPQISDEELAQRVFVSGVSTADQSSRVSGRGVGLDAVQAFVRRQGGDVRIAFTGPAHAGCRPFDLVLELPEDATLPDERPRTVSERPVLTD
jgi:histidine kinase